MLFQLYLCEWGQTIMCYGELATEKVNNLVLSYISEWMGVPYFSILEHLRPSLEEVYSNSKTFKIGVFKAPSLSRSEYFDRT